MLLDVRLCQPTQKICWRVAPFRRSGLALIHACLLKPIQASPQVPPLDRVGDQIESSSIRQLGLARPPTPAQQVSPGGVKEVISVQFIGNWFHEGQTSIGSVGHGDRDRSVQLDHW